AQDKLARSQLAGLLRREQIRKRLAELSYLDSLSAPTRRGDRVFLSRRHATKEKEVVYWKPATGGGEKVLFDPNTWSKDGSISLGVWSPSWDGKRVAYAVRQNNSDEAVLHVIDVETMK